MDKKSSFVKAFKQQWFIWAFLIVAAIFVVFPIFWMISVSLRHNGDIFSFPVKLLPSEWTFEVYKNIFGNTAQLKYFLNSYVYGFAVTIIAMIVGIMAGYGLSRYEFKGKRIFSMFVLSTQTVPAVTILIPLFILFVQYGLYNTGIGLVLAYTTFALPYAIIMMLGFFNSVSMEIDEAARIDGAGDFRTLWQVIVPITIPGIVSTMIYIFILSWNEYLFAMQLIKSDALRTIPIGIAFLKGEASYEWNEIMGLSVLGSIPVLILYLIGQRKFIAGLSDGAVKG